MKTWTAKLCGSEFKVMRLNDAIISPETEAEATPAKQAEPVKTTDELIAA